MTELHIKNKEELEAFAAEFLSRLKTKACEKALVVGLSGDLGSGKTTFSQIIARLLGVEDTVTSPTFIIQKNYATKDEVFESLVHMDAYRIDDIEELSSMRFGKQLAVPRSLMLIEWPEKFRKHCLQMPYV